MKVTKAPRKAAPPQPANAGKELERALEGMQAAYALAADEAIGEIYSNISQTLQSGAFDSIMV